VAELTKCIRTNLDCADICASAGKILSRHTGYDANVTRAVLEACRVTCKACADECEAMHRCMSIARFVPKPAGAASRLVPNCWEHSGSSGKGRLRSAPSWAAVHAEGVLLVSSGKFGAIGWVLVSREVWSA
jgi:hypothetical protein